MIYKKIIFFSLFFSTFLIQAQISDTSLPFSSNNTLSEHKVDNGFETTKNGTKYVLKSNLTLTSDYSASSTIEINSANKTNVFISIKHNNITIDLNDLAIITNKSGYVAIAIADDVQNVTIQNGTIESGSQSFDTAIMIGQNTANIVFDNINIIGCSHADGAIKCTGTSGEKVDSITFKDITFLKNTRNALNCSYVANMKLENILCSAQTSGSALSVINIDNSNTIRGQNIDINNSTGDSGTIGLDIDASNNIALQNISISNNTDASGEVHTEGIKINNSNNIDLNYFEVNNLTKGKYAVSALASKNIALSYFKINNNSSGTGQPFTAMYIKNSQIVNVSEGTISNNTGTTSFNGILCDTATNKMINFVQVGVLANTASSGALVGLDIQNTRISAILGCNITQNTSTDNLYGLKITTSSRKAFCQDVHVTNNTSSTSATSKIVSGIYVDGAHGIKIDDCSATENTGSGSMYGFTLINTNGARLNNCMAIGNKAATGIADQLPSAGIYLLTCNDCSVENSQFINNKAGNRAPGAGGSTTISVTTSCSGHGIANIGTNNSV